MRLKDHPERDGKRVWLAESEMQSLLDQADGPIQRVAFLLAGRVGLRRDELVQIRPKDFVDGPTGTHVRVWEDYAKRDQYREPPVPDELKTTVEAVSYQASDDEPVVDVNDHTVYRWVKRAAERLEEGTGDEGWQFVSPHDLRRTWGTALLERGVIPSVVMSWGGWNDWETFRKHYLGEFSPEGIKRERAKVPYLEGDADGDVDMTAVTFSPPAGKSRSEH